MFRRIYATALKTKLDAFMPSIPKSSFATDASRMDSPAEVFASIERRMREAIVVIADSDHSEKCRMGSDKTDPDEMDNVLSQLSNDLSHTTATLLLQNPAERRRTHNGND
jgi:hypothetical protein